MARLLTLDDLQKHIERARRDLSLERESLLSLSPLPENFSRDAYGFSYMRAERIGMDAISERLEEVSWLPMQIDPNAEILPESKQTIKKWLSSSSQIQPSSEIFGNDFIHALARVALSSGWESAEFHKAVDRVGALFHDLSCLIGLIYYGIWMTENGFGGVAITNPYDLEQTTKEIAALSHSPEIMDYLYQRQKLLAEGQPQNKKKNPCLHLVPDESGPSDSPPGA